MLGKRIRPVWLLATVVGATVASVYLFRQTGGLEIRFSKAVDSPTVAPIPPPIPWHEVDADLVVAFQQARETAELFATEQLALWQIELERRIDEDFLEWYFSYFNQQWLGLKAIGYWTTDQIFRGGTPAPDSMSTDIKEAFEKRVLRPEAAQLRIEGIARGTVSRYVANLRERVQTLPDKYRIPRADWDRYLSDLASITKRSEGNREIPLSLKTIVCATTVGGAIASANLSSALKPVWARVQASVSRRSAAFGSEALIARATGRTGARFAGKATGRMLGPIIGGGVLAWDLWDHHATREAELPVLRDSLMEYLEAFGECLLRDPEAGVFTIVDGLERSMVAALPPV